ncbi:MAG: MFS transporter [Spirochaetes bacterium]|jgi:PPP family 3-phenylpropionic acid transporter|nr:MFS transporter [Spirochaetota bacterium]
MRILVGGQTARFSLLQFLFWSSIVCFEAFLVPYLRSVGYAPSQVGTVMAAVFGFALVGQPILGSITDRIRSPRYLVTGVLVLAAVVVNLMPLVRVSLIAIVGLALLYSVTANSLPAVLDAWIMSRRETPAPPNYGIARGFGSLGFAAAAVIIGYLTDRYGLELLFPAYLVLVLAAAATALFMPRPPRLPPRERPASRQREAAVEWSPEELGLPSPAPEVRTPPVRGFIDGLRAVLRNRSYLLLLGSAMVAFTGLRAGITFIPLLIEEVDGTVSDVGLAHSIGALSEVPLFFLSGLILRRYRGFPLLGGILILFAVRLFAYTLVGSAGGVLALQLTHGLTFGLFLAAAVDHVHRIAPPEHRGFFQALAPSVYFGIGSILGSWLGGIIIEATSVVILYRLAAGASLVAAVPPLVAARAGFSGSRR